MIIVFKYIILVISILIVSEIKFNSTTTQKREGEFVLSFLGFLKVNKKVLSNGMELLNIFS